MLQRRFIGDDLFLKLKNTGGVRSGWLQCGGSVCGARILLTSMGVESRCSIRAAKSSPKRRVRELSARNGTKRALRLSKSNKKKRSKKNENNTAVFLRKYKNLVSCLLVRDEIRGRCPAAPLSGLPPLRGASSRLQRTTCVEALVLIGTLLPRAPPGSEKRQRGVSPLFFFFFCFSRKPSSLDRILSLPFFTLT